MEFDRIGRFDLRALLIEVDSKDSSPNHHTR